MPLLSYLPLSFLFPPLFYIFLPFRLFIPPSSHFTYLPTYLSFTIPYTLPPSPHLLSNSLPFFIYLLTTPSFHIPLPSFHSYFLPSFIFLYSSSSLLPSSLSIPYFHASLFRSFITFFNFFILHLSPFILPSFLPSFPTFLSLSFCLLLLLQLYIYSFLPFFISFLRMYYVYLPPYISSIQRTSHLL